MRVELPSCDGLTLTLGLNPKRGRSTQTLLLGVVVDSWPLCSVFVDCTPADVRQQVCVKLHVCNVSSGDGSRLSKGSYSWVQL